MKRRGPLLGAYWFYRQPRELASHYFRFQPGLGDFADVPAECRGTFTIGSVAPLEVELQRFRNQYLHSAVRLEKGRSRSLPVDLFTISMQSRGFFDWDFHLLSLMEQQLIALGAAPQDELRPETERAVLVELAPEQEGIHVFAERRFQLVAADTPSGAENLCIRIDPHPADPPGPAAPGH